MTAVTTPRQRGALGVDAPPRYRPAPPPFTGARLCHECGAIVLLVREHNAHHARLAGQALRVEESETRLDNTRARLSAAEKKLDGRSRPRPPKVPGADGA